MTYTFPTPDEIENFNKRPGRPTSYVDLSPQAVKAIATRLEQKGFSDHAWHVIELLGHVGVMSDAQLGFLTAASTLGDYTKEEKPILNKLPFTPTELETALQEHGLDCGKDPHLYVLSPVGIELVSRRLGITPVSGHLSYRMERVMHDLLVNEIVLRLYRFGIRHGWRVTLSGTNDGALYSADASHKLLEPDALIRMQKGEQEPVLFCIEYHNEDKRSRAERKVDKYELVRANNVPIWQTTWDTDAFPHVLAVFSKRIVGDGYRDKLLANPSVETRFYGKVLDGVLQDNLDEWINMATGEREAILA